jgi:hypothetical protein
MRYTGRLFYPRGARLSLDLSALSPIQGRVAYDLYAQFKREMDAEEFDARVDVGAGRGGGVGGGDDDPIFLRFRRVGETAAYVAFARGGGGGGDAGGADTAATEAADEARDLRAVMGLLARLDRDEDEQVIDELSAKADLAGVIDEDDWAAARAEPKPLSAAFFVDEAALNDPLLHGLMSLAGAAFFDRLGLLS